MNDQRLTIDISFSENTTTIISAEVPKLDSQRLIRMSFLNHAYQLAFLITRVHLHSQHGVCQHHLNHCSSRTCLKPSLCFCFVNKLLYFENKGFLIQWDQLYNTICNFICNFRVIQNGRTLFNRNYMTLCQTFIIPFGVIPNLIHSTPGLTELGAWTAHKECRVRHGKWNWMPVATGRSVWPIHESDIDKAITTTRARKKAFDIRLFFFSFIYAAFLTICWPALG